MRRLIKIVVVVSAVVLALSVIALAYSGYLNTFNTRYGTSGTRLDTCDLCHIPPGKTVRNPYGVDYASNGHNFANIEGLDSDGDGWTNLQEINVLSFPGDPLDYPTDVKSQNGTVPDNPFLLYNYPNPFNSSTVIEFNLIRSSNVELVVYDVLGRKAITLVNQFLTAGPKQVIWDGKTGRGEEAASGVYFYVIKTDSFTKVRRMVLLR